MLTADALFALTAIGILATSYAVISSIQFHSQKYADLERQGRDYLELAYRQGLLNFTNDSFFNLTRHQCHGCIDDYEWTFDTEEGIAGWAPLVGEWLQKSENGGVYREPGIPVEYSYTSAGKYYWSNYSLNTFVYQDNIGGTDILGIGVHGNSTGGRYFCGLDFRVGARKLLLWKAFNWTSVLSAPAEKAENIPNLADTTWYSLNLSVNGNLVNCSLYNDSITSLVLSDPAPFPSGKISLERGNDVPAVDFDNVTVTGGNTLPPADVPLAVRASMVEYPWYCGCPPFAVNCTVNKTHPCLAQQEPLERDWEVREVWVS